MAKDPAFLFYSADASEDVSHMNRLERGCYFDFIQAQRKFHGITMEQAQKILGKDFEQCWPALELVLSKDETGFFISWMRDGINQRKAHADKQRKKIQDYWDRKKLEEHNRGNSAELPLEDGIGVVNEDVKEKKERRKKFTPDLSLLPDYMKTPLQVWMKYKSERKENYTETGYSQLIERLKTEYPNGVGLFDAIRHSCSNNWQGIFPKDKPSNTKVEKVENNPYEIDQRYV